MPRRGGVKSITMWTVYILESLSAKRHYVGCSNNLARRLREHNSGSNKATLWHKPWRVIYSEEFEDQTKAYLREKQIKSYKGGNAFKKLLTK